MRVNSRIGPPVDSQSDAPATLNVSGYLFVPVADPEALRDHLERALGACGVRGTVLIAREGINVALAGTARRGGTGRGGDRVGCPVRAAAAQAQRVARRALRAAEGAPQARDHRLRRHRPRGRAASAGRDAGRARPRRLDEGWAPCLLDTRNAYEVEAGAFEGALSLGIGHFREFRDAVEAALADGTLDVATPLVTYCTGGVRCEKAAPWLIERGFAEVVQLDGGILDWFAARGGERWRGDCFVFDDRVSVDAALAPTGAALCPGCGTAVRPDARCACPATARPANS